MTVLASITVHEPDQKSRPQSVPRWTAYLPQVMAVIDVLHEPDQIMQEAGSVIIRHVGHEKSQAGYQSDAANACAS